MLNTICINRQGEVERQAITVNNVPRALNMGYGVEVKAGVVMCPNKDRTMVSADDVDGLINHGVMCFSVKAYATAMRSATKVVDNGDGTASFVGPLVGMGF